MSVFVNTANKGTLNMRAEPKSNAAVLARIPYGTELSIEVVDEQWAYTVYKDKCGYVMTQFLSSSSSSTISKADVKKIYDSLKQTLKTIEEVLN